MYFKSVKGLFWNQIRIWSNKGEGDYSDYPAARNAIYDIKSMPDNSFIVCSGNPDFSRMKTDGTQLFYNAAETNCYVSENSIYDKVHFKINNDGTEIGITPVGKADLTFSINDRLLALKTSDGKSYTDNYSGINITDWRILANSKSPKINFKATNFLRPNELNISVDISEGTKKIVFGGTYAIHCTDVNGTNLWSTPVQSYALFVNICDNGKVVAAAFGDGTIRWYSMDNGDLLFSLFLHPDNKRWMLWSPQGYFDCSSGAEDLIGWHVNQGADKEALYYPASQFYEKFYTPNLGARILAGEEINISDVNISSFKLPPNVKITSPVNNSNLNTEQLTITVEVTDQGGGIDEILLYHNGKLVQTTSRGFRAVVQKDTKTSKTFTIPLINGVNKIKATAFNTQRTEAIPNEITINYSGTQASSSMYILAVGINLYTNTRYSLNYAINDANGFVEALKTGASSIFSNINTTIVNDAQATRIGILDAVEKINAKIKLDDVFVFYYAGHGVMSSGSATEKPDFYLVPADVTKMYEADEILKTKGISAEEIGEFSKNIKAQKQLFVLDACQSGGAMLSIASRGAAEEKAIAQLARSTGTYFIAASGTEQFATEVKELGHGVFTYSIIEALKGLCKSQDGKVTVNLLKSCVEDRVPELTKKYKGEAQFPTGYGFGQDFPIVIVK